MHFFFQLLVAETELPFIQLSETEELSTVLSPALLIGQLIDTSKAPGVQTRKCKISFISRLSVMGKPQRDYFSFCFSSFSPLFQDDPRVLEICACRSRSVT